jgi:hypothetical protein
MMFVTNDGSTHTVSRLTILYYTVMVWSGWWLTDADTGVWDWWWDDVYYRAFYEDPGGLVWRGSASGVPLGRLPGNPPGLDEWFIRASLSHWYAHWRWRGNMRRGRWTRRHQ